MLLLRPQSPRTRERTYEVTLKMSAGKWSLSSRGGFQRHGDDMGHPPPAPASPGSPCSWPWPESWRWLLSWQTFTPDSPDCWACQRSHLLGKVWVCSTLGGQGPGTTSIAIAPSPSSTASSSTPPILPPPSRRKGLHTLSHPAPWGRVAELSPHRGEKGPAQSLISLTTAQSIAPTPPTVRQTQRKISRKRTRTPSESWTRTVERQSHR